MNETEFDELLSIVASAKVSKALFYNIVLSFDEIQKLHKHIGQMWIMSDKAFFKKFNKPISTMIHDERHHLH